MSRVSTGLLRCVLVAALAGFAGFGTLSAEESTDLTTETRALLEGINETRAEIADLRAQWETAEGEERLIIEHRRQDKGIEALDELDTLVNNIVELENDGQDAAEFREGAEELVLLIPALVQERIAELTVEISELAATREETTGEDLVSLEAELAEDSEKLSLVMGAAVDNAFHMEALGLDASGEKDHLIEVLAERAESFAARIELAAGQAEQLRERLSEKPDDADLTTELSAVETKLDRSTETLKTTIGMLERLGVDTANYERLLIEATGQITADILDADVALGLFGQWMGRIRTWFVESGPALFFKVLVFVLILLVFRLLAKFTRKIVARGVKTSKLQFSQLLQKMFVSAAGNAVWAVGLLVALSQLGFALGPILAGLGIMGFIVGFALQDTLGNFAAGMMILIYRPYDVGDFIEAATVFGKVNAMSMVSTTILTVDNQTLVVPNGKIWGDVIRNVTHQKVRRVDLVFGIGYGDDIPLAEKVLMAILKEHPRVLDDPVPVVKLHTLNESSVDFVVRPWCLTDDYWDIHYDVTREVKMRFDKEGIGIPFPQRDIHIYEEKRLSAAGARDSSES
jgi:small conductance mechanosensitive channel